MENETFTLKRGLSNVFAAEVTGDDNEISGGYVSGTPFHLIPAGEMAVTVDGETVQVYFDNTVFASVGREGNSELTLDGAGLRPTAIAKLNGKDVDTATGMVFDSGEWAEKYYALGAIKDNIDGTKEYFWFLKGTFSVPDDNAKTKDDTTDTNGTSLTYTAIPTKHVFEKTGKVCKRVVMDDSDTTATTKVDFSKWFESVVTPDNIPTVV